MSAETVTSNDRIVVETISQESSSEETIILTTSNGDEIRMTEEAADAIAAAIYRALVYTGYYGDNEPGDYTGPVSFNP